MDMNKDVGRRPSRRGFAAMDPERRREIARRGGASVPSEKRSFAQDRDLAATAGSARPRRSPSFCSTRVRSAKVEPLLRFERAPMF